MEKERVYSFGEERLKRGQKKGFEICGDGLLAESNESCILLPYIDRGQGERDWGRIHVETELKEGAELTVLATAFDDREWNAYMSDERVPLTHKVSMLREGGGNEHTNKRDILIYEQKGRYLWLFIRVRQGAGSKLQKIRVYTKGDFLMEEFPQIFQQRNSVLHRYLSVFSTMLKDMEEKTEKFADIVGPETAPQDMLPALADFMGLDVSAGFLKEKVLRKLVAEAYELRRIRGTRAALIRLVELLTGTKPIIIERNLMEKPDAEERRQVEDRLYGSSIYDVTVLMENVQEECDRSGLLKLMNSLKPIRCVLKPVYLGTSSVLDGYTYMDVNAGLENDRTPAVLDTGARLGQNGGLVCE